MTKILLTKTDIKKIKKQIQELEEKIIPRINKELQTAIADGDLRENAPFDIAKQRLVEARNKLQELKELLKTAKIVKQATTKTIGINSKVKIIIDNVPMELQIVGIVDADPLSGKYSSNSPLAQALLGKKTGDVAHLSTPNGEEKIIKIIEVS